MAFAEDFDHLSLPMENNEHKQEQKLAVEALLLGKYAGVCYGRATNWFRQDHYL